MSTRDSLIIYLDGKPHSLNLDSLDREYVSGLDRDTINSRFVQQCNDDAHLQDLVKQFQDTNSATTFVDLKALAQSHAESVVSELRKVREESLKSEKNGTVNGVNGVSEHATTEVEAAIAQG